MYSNLAGPQGWPRPADLIGEHRACKPPVKTACEIHVLPRIHSQHPREDREEIVGPAELVLLQEQPNRPGARWSKTEPGARETPLDGRTPGIV